MKMKKNNLPCAENYQNTQKNLFTSILVTLF